MNQKKMTPLPIPPIKDTGPLVGSPLGSLKDRAIIARIRLEVKEEKKCCEESGTTCSE